MRRPARLVLAAAALLTLAPDASAESPAPAPAPKAALPAITVTRVEAEVLTERVHASGLVGAVETVEVQPRVTGMAVETLLADVGDRVEAGQVLARLSTAELDLKKSQLEAQRASAEAAIAQAEAQRVQAKASSDEAQRVLDRSQSLRETGNLSQSALDQAQAAATTAKAQLAVAEAALAAARAQLKVMDAQLADVALQLSRTEVVAPVAGEIVDRAATVGSIASPAAAPMFTIIRDGALELLGDVAEQDVLKLQPGQPATLRFVGLDGVLTGRVRLVEPRVDTVTRLGRVRIAIDDSARVRPGMFAEGEIVVARRMTPAIPVSAIAAGDDGTRVLKVVDGVVHMATIITGIRDGAMIEVTEGLAEGDSVVLKAGAFLREGERISPVPAGAGN